jgi:RNA polymerase sigma-70 factor (ECF subfamily)
VSTDDHAWVADALKKYERPLLRYAAWLLVDRDRARDVVQEVFLRLCRESRERVEDHLAAWLFTVCRNLSLDVAPRFGERSVTRQENPCPLHAWCSWARPRAVARR